ncbi:MAG: enoyl-CoA hydratase/isomerase family protein [Myxococcales bacterium]|nr:enoyl-CoA hydratase/isomerase family protein [Myxococcales bacterium]MBL0193280.1 enoyl-CoA hydratase/isomerase family protein [Myxococcales bacterium]HQY63007.1 enoyl-CoA hydratase/isomerase family protein [Polyangiaceae bacterium]
MSAIAVERERDGAVLHIVLSAPRSNVLTMAMMGEIDAALAAHREQRELKLVVLRGEGEHFSFGASVPEHRADTAPEMLQSFHRLVRAVAGYPVPVASLVLGRCLGGAFELVLASHLVFAARSAVFACPEVKLGVVPPVLCVLGHHRLGGALSERLILTGAEIDAAQAAASGMVAAVIPTEREPREWLREWYDHHLASLSAYALREATWAARHGSGLLQSLGSPLDAAEARYLARVAPSRDGQEGIEAFIARRPPIWTGE